MNRTAMACLLLMASAGAVAEGAKEDTEAKAISGISIVGNNETPKSLYIVPWKSSESGAEDRMKSGLLDESLAPLDREVFQRQLDFYEVSKTN